MKNDEIVFNFFRAGFDRRFFILDSPKFQRYVKGAQINLPDAHFVIRLTRLGKLIVAGGDTSDHQS